jgi:hypothetical protein
MDPGSLVLLLVLVGATPSVQAANGAGTQQSPSQHHEEVQSRGDHAMGFSHENSTHHFRLYKTGGAIEVSADDPADSATRDQIRMHLSHIVNMFSAGDFDIPMFIHSATPPGAPTMSKLRDQIHYQYQDTRRGGKIRISSANAEAVDAIHSFLRFQISDHQTGDSPNIQ